MSHLIQGQDLASGNLTAPALYALTGAHGPELLALIESEFTAEGGLPRAIHLVNAGGGITSARALARREADLVRTLQAVPLTLIHHSTPLCLHKALCILHRNLGTPLVLIHTSNHLNISQTNLRSRFVGCEDTTVEGCKHNAYFSSGAEVSTDCINQVNCDLCLAFHTYFASACLQALESLSCLQDCDSKRSLVMMVEYVLDRLY